MESLLSVPNQKRCVTFIVEAGSKYGLGHLKRMEVLAQELIDRGWYTLLFVTDELLAASISKPFHEVYQWQGKCSAVSLSSLVVIDGYHFPYSLYEDLKEGPYFTVAMDDLGDRDLLVNCVVNHNIYGGRIDYSTREAQYILAGPKYGLVAKEFRAIEESLTRLDRDILISFGGTDDGKYSIPLIRYLLNKTDDYTVHVVCSPLLTPKDELILLEKEHKQVVVHHGADMCLLMRRCKYFIGAAGYSLMEAIVAGMEVYTCAIVNNQSINAEEYKSRKGRALDHYDAEALIDMFLEDIQLDYKVSISCLDGLGASRIVDFLEKV